MLPLHQTPKFGAGRQNRTADAQLFRLTLYQLSYPGILTMEPYKMSACCAALYTNRQKLNSGRMGIEPILLRRKRSWYKPQAVINWPYPEGFLLFVNLSLRFTCRIARTSFRFHSVIENHQQSICFAGTVLPYYRQVQNSFKRASKSSPRCVCNHFSLSNEETGAPRWCQN